MGVCLAVFARAPTPGQCKTRLAATIGEVPAAQLYRSMLLDTLHSLLRVPATRFVLLAAQEHDGVAVLSELAPPRWAVIPQAGDTLGDRLECSMKTLARVGDGVVMVGSDSPLLPVDALARSLPHLAGHRRALLGPAMDGGYYLIGLSAPAASVFQGIRWSTSTVLDETRSRLQQASFDTLELPATADVDVMEDLTWLSREFGDNPGRAPRTAAWLADRQRTRPARSAKP